MPHQQQPDGVRRPPAVGRAESVRASRAWWDGDAAAYLAEHGAFLGSPDGAARFVWGPEGWTEDDLGLLGDVAGRRVLEVGAGAGQCSRWLADRGAQPVALDLSAAMLRAAGGSPVPRVQADAGRLPFRDGCFDLACSSYGAMPFLPDLTGVFAEVARVLRPGGRWVFSAPHPVRWAFPDDPGPRGLTADRPYFDRSGYVERDEAGVVTYVEHHHTLGDHVRALAGSGFRILDLVEPEWPAWNRQAWDGWSPLRGEILPGTAIWVCELTG